MAVSTPSLPGVHLPSASLRLGHERASSFPLPWLPRKVHQLNTRIRFRSRPMDHRDITSGSSARQDSSAGPGWLSRARSKEVPLQVARARAEGRPDEVVEARPVEVASLLQWLLTPRNLQVVSAALITTVLAVANRVLYKLALVPLRDYPFFLAQVTTFGYVGVYATTLFVRRQLGIVTDDMLRLPKKRFVAMGLLEAIGLALGMVSAIELDGALIPILAQTFLAWQLALSYVFLKKRFSLSQLAGCALVIAGVVRVVASGSATGAAVAAGPLWPLLFILSTAFPAGSSVLKEGVFSDSRERLKGRSVDLFVVNTLGSSFQALFVLCLLPFLSALRGIPIAQLPRYLAAGSICLVNPGGGIKGCEGAPLLPLLYVAGNLAFNISALNLLRVSSAIVASLCMTLSVPLTIFVFTFRLPYLGDPAPLPGGFWTGSIILILGVLLYNVSSQRVVQTARAKSS